MDGNSVTVNSLDIVISNSTKDASASIEKLIASLGRLKNVLSGDFSAPIKSLVSGMRTLNNYAKQLDTSALSNYAKELERIAVASNKIQSLPSIKAVSAKATSPANEIKDGGTLTQSTTQVASTTTADTSTVKPEEHIKVDHSESKKSAEDYLASLKRVDIIQQKLQIAQSNFKAAYDENDAQSMARYADQVDRLQRSLAGSQQSGLGKIANQFEGILEKQVFRRLSFAIISTVTRAVSNGIQEIYKVNDQFAKSMDGIVSDLANIGSSIASVLVPVIEVVRPVLSLVATGLAEIANLINWLIAKMTQSQTMTFVTNSVTKKLNESAQKVVQSFDELHQLNTESKSSVEQIQVKDFWSKFNELANSNETANSIVDSISGAVAKNPSPYEPREEKTFWDKIVNFPAKAFDKISDVFNTVTQKIFDRAFFRGKYALDIPGFASGGFPTSGQLFIANEAGPELVGSIGNKTAVVNNDQIIQGVSEGVANAQNAQNRLISEQNDILRAILSRTGIISIDGRTIKSAYDRANAIHGAPISTGGVII